MPSELKDHDSDYEDDVDEYDEGAPKQRPNKGKGKASTLKNAGGGPDVSITYAAGFNMFDPDGPGLYRDILGKRHTPALGMLSKRTMVAVSRAPLKNFLSEGEGEGIVPGTGHSVFQLTIKHARNEGYSNLPAPFGERLYAT